jgi:tetratricopeptide (TPR) repeat protein
MRVGNRARITAHLIDASSERHLWSNDYDRETGDVLSLHRDLARAITREVRAALSDGEAKGLAAARKAKPAAVEAYLRGLHLRNQGPQNLPEQLKLARDAVRLDPEYALGHWLLARTLQSLGDYARAPYPEVVPEARAEIAKALELEPDLAAAYQLLSWSLLTVDQDWEGAEKAARKAKDLDPASNISGVHFARGRIEQALEENRQELRRDPLNVNVIAYVGINLGALRRYGEALEWLRKAVAIEPGNEYALQALGINLFLAGRLDEAAEAHVQRHPPENRAALLDVYRKRGWNAFCGESLRLRASRPNQSAQQIARTRMTHGILMGDHNAALEGLETLEKTGDAFLAQLALPIFHPIRNEPRFKAVLKRLRYPESMWR